MVINLKLLLYPGEDDDLRAFFAAAPVRRRANAVKTALRTGNITVAAAETGPEDAELADLLAGLLFEG
jgi:hypothetical protein